jgi:hypothetical protein
MTRQARSALVAVIEAGAIALFSNFDRPSIDPPSARWLGRRASHHLVGVSGLWNVNHVGERAGRPFLDVFERWLGRL